ncbi:MAG: PEP-CTERM sorting domain-containing protein, partial [Akkermansia sp.]|nr:PEP-CTERM sorting domain-containing protein [Akkermansia sp.]
ADTTASADEIRASQTSKLNAAVKLHNGTLRVEDGAELQLTSLSIAENATVKLTNGALTLGGSATLRSDSTTGLVSDVLLENGKIDGGGSHASMSDVFISTINEAFSISDVSMENVHFESELTTLTLTNVSFDNGSSFSVGETGIIILDNAIVNYSLDNLASSSGVFTADLTELFHCSTQGQLELNIDTEALAQHGYTGLAVQFGEDVNADAMAIRLNGITYDYAGAVDSNGAPSFSINIIPEPATSTLSLLALAGLAARRRRK